MVEHADSYLQLISLAVHEFRTPASVVAGYLRMLLRDTEQPPNERQRKMLEEAERSCQRLAAIVGELSDIQKLDAERVELARQRVDLFALISTVAESVQEASDRGVSLELRGPATGAEIMGDRVRLERALTAVFRAILRETPSNTTVVGERRLVSSADGGSAVLTVAPEAHVQKSYEAPRAPFDETRGGLGLLLPFARRVIERHGGAIWSPSGDSGRGAAVLSLPVTEPTS